MVPIALALVVLAAFVTLSIVLHRLRSPRRAPAQAAPSLVGATERWRDGVVGPSGARREVALRCAFPQADQSQAWAPWAIMNDQGLLALVSPTGRDSGWGRAAQEACASALARALPAVHTGKSDLGGALIASDQAISAIGAKPSLGAATAVVLSLGDHALESAHVGGDRVYALRAGSADQLTSDHTLAFDQLRREGKRARDSRPDIDALPASVRAGFTRVLGAGRVTPDLARHALAGDEWLVILSHDVALSIGEVRLQQLLDTTPSSPRQLAEQLVVEAHQRRPTAFAAAAVLSPARA